MHAGRGFYAVTSLSQNITQLNVTFTEAGSVSQTTAGWTVGGGAEYAFDNHWSVKAEYLYVDPGSVSFSTAGNPAPSYISTDLITAFCKSPGSLAIVAAIRRASIMSLPNRVLVQNSKAVGGLSVPTALP